MQNPFRLFIAFFTIAFAQPAHAEVISYYDALHMFWKLSPPDNYEPFIDSYADLVSDVRKINPAHELETVHQPEITTEEIKENVEETNLNEPLILTTHLRLGQYSHEQQAFAFINFNPGTYFAQEPPRSRLQTLPTVKIRTLNTLEVKWLPMPEPIAKALLDENRTWGGISRLVEVDMTILPKSAKSAKKEVRVNIVDMVVRLPSNFSTKWGRMEIAHLTFDPDTGKLLTSEYTGMTNNE